MPMGGVRLLASCSLALSAQRSDKAELRARMRGVLGALAPLPLASASARACQRALELPALERAESVSIFLSMPSAECQTDTLVEELFRRGKAVYVPRVDGKHAEQMSMVRMESIEQLRALETNRWGIPEPHKPPPGAPPATAEERGELVDVVIVPALAFDRRCYRLGHGRGYYDAFLARVLLQRAQARLERPAIIGLGLQEQLLDSVPVLDHDIQLDCVCLPECVLHPPEAS